MADGDFDFRIRISTPADVSGADTARSAIDDLAKSSSGVEEAGERGAKGIARMIEEAGTVREAQRIAQGFFDIFLGGGRTIQGTAEIMRFFIASAADINPIFAALAVVGSSIAVVAGRQGEHNEKMKEGATVADAFATSIERSQTRVRTAYETSERQNANLTTALEAQAKASEAQATALEKTLGLMKQLNDQNLTNLENEALAKNTGGPAGDVEIRHRFDSLRRGSDLKYDLGAIDTQEQANLDAQGNTEKQRQLKQKELDDAQAQLDALTANRDRTARVAGVFGATVNQDEAPEKQAEAWAKLQETASKNLSDAAKAFSDASQVAQNFRDQSPAFKAIIDPLGQQQANLDTEVSRRNQQLIEAGERERAVANADRAQAAFADDKTGALAQQAIIDKNTQELTDLGTKVTELKDALNNLDLQKALTISTAKTEQAAADTKAAQDLLAAQNADFTKKNEAAIKVQEDFAGNPDNLLSDREAALRRAASLRSGAVQRQIDQGQQPGPNNLSSDELAALRQQMTENQAETNRRIQEMEDSARGVSADKRPEYDAAAKALQALVDQGTRLVNGGNNGTAQAQLAYAGGDLRAQGAFLSSYFQGSGNGSENLLSQQIAQALAQYSGALPPSSGKGAANTTAYDTDQLSTKLNEATTAAGDAGMKDVVTAVNKSIDLHQKVAELVAAFRSSVNAKLQAYAAQLQQLDDKVRSDGNRN